MKYNKFRVAPKAERTCDGIVFHSKKEMQRYCELKLLAEAGLIARLQRQYRYPIEVNGVHCAFWDADFVYFEAGRLVVEDVKGVRTDIYKLKKKLIEAIYDFTITEI